MTPFERSDLLEILNKEANEIIREKGLDFGNFFIENTLYMYNICVAHSWDYKKLTPHEWQVLLIIIKREHDRLPYIIDEYRKELENAE